jgi:hypothetical protein
MKATATELVSLSELDPHTYQSHMLHGPQRIYREINCYTDILVELLHAHGEEPLAAMGGAVAMDFEGDQWTFFKPAPEDLLLLHGLDIHEMQPYRPLPEQIAEQIAHGRTIAVEVDSWYLPDTVATSYRSEHVKSSIVAQAIDTAGERLQYFHATGLYELRDEDYRGVFRIGRPFSDDVLPPYTELVRFDKAAAVDAGELRATAAQLLRGHLKRRPTTNPFVRFGEQLHLDLPRLLDGDAADYHAYAFATVRMSGAAFEAAAAHMDWLLASAGAAARDAFVGLAEGCKALSFRLARRRDFDPQPAIETLAATWGEAQGRLDDALD